MVDELVELGHDVTLFASGDSKTKGKLHAIWPRALRLGRRGADPNAACALLIEAIAERAGGFDVIHSHVDWLPLPVLSRTSVPFLTTMHGRLDLPAWRTSSALFRRLLSSPSPTISAGRFRTRTGSRRFRTDCPRTCFDRRSKVDRTSLFPDHAVISGNKEQLKALPQFKYSDYN
ncbi:hypothetical protein ACVWW5_001889 [Bradyrhizobium sp. LM3.4]|jgi:hypothetical protein